MAFLAFALFLIVEARKLTYMTSIGPGPGFLPLWIGGMIAILALVELVRVSLRPAGATGDVGFVPTSAGILRVVAIIAAVGLFGLLVDTLGFQLSMFSLLMFLLVALGRQNLLLTVALALAGSFGQYYVFRTLLDVRLPASSIDFLANLGL